MSDWRHARTARLRLDEPVDADAEGLLAIHADPASWVHLPSGRVTDPGAGATMVGASRRRFERDGLAYWSVRDEEGGPVVGRGGCAVPDEALDADPTGRGWWNLSRRTVEKLGLGLVWRGPDAGNPDPDAVRLVFLDREPDDTLVAALAAEGMASRHLVGG